MIVAISIWNQRIAPVFDVSRTALLCLIKEGRVMQEYLEGLPAEDPVGKIHALQNLETDVLICGAISKSVLELAEMYGIVTFPFTSGNVEEVKVAYTEDRLGEPCFVRPGCRRRRRMRCQAGAHPWTRDPFSQE